MQTKQTHPKKITCFAGFTNTKQAFYKKNPKNIQVLLCCYFFVFFFFLK